MTGTKFRRGIGAWGACIVHPDDNAVCSSITSVVDAANMTGRDAARSSAIRSTAAPSIPTMPSTPCGGGVECMFAITATSMPSGLKPLGGRVTLGASCSLSSGQCCICMI
jgi:hypothetical protein